MTRGGQPSAVMGGIVGGRETTDGQWGESGAVEDCKEDDGEAARGRTCLDIAGGAAGVRRVEANGRWGSCGGWGASVASARCGSPAWVSGRQGGGVMAAAQKAECGNEMRCRGANEGAKRREWASLLARRSITARTADTSQSTWPHAVALAAAPSPLPPLATRAATDHTARAGERQRDAFWNGC